MGIPTLFFINLQASLPLGKGYFQIQFEDSDYYESPQTHTLLDFGKISVGNDEDSDLILFPSNFDIKFRVDGDTEKWFNILKDMYNQYVEVDFVIDNEVIFEGVVDKYTLKANKDLKTISFKVFDKILNLKEYYPEENPVGYPVIYDTIINIKQAIIDILSLVHSSASVEVNSYIEGRLTYDDVEYIEGFNEFGTWLTSWYEYNTIFANMLEVLKCIMVNFNMIGYMTFDRTLKLIPRMHEANPVYNINVKQIMEFIQFEHIQAIDGIKAEVWNGDDPQNDPQNWFPKTVGNTEGKLVENLRLTHHSDAGAYGGSNVYFPVDGNWRQIASGQNFRIKKFDNTYTDWDYLWKYPVNTVFEMVNKKRYKIKVVVPGNYKQWTFDYFYKIPGIDMVFRPSKIDYDFIKNKCTLYLRSVESV